jgi:hypothetical protein
MSQLQVNSVCCAGGGERQRYTIKRRPYTRHWEVLDPEGELVCLTAYRRGARALLRHFGEESWNEP